METAFNTIHPEFKLNGTHLNLKLLKETAFSLIESREEYEKQIGGFLQEWLDDNAFITLKTSGSTGQPKTLSMPKQAMVNSALATGQFFNLQPGQTALLCLPAHYIAGKMMLVRAMVLGLHIDVINPKVHLNLSLGKTYHFCAMIPIQVEKNLEQLTSIKTLIVGGAAVSKTLEDNIKGLKTKVFATYGMTETVSHIALKPLNHTSHPSLYNVLPGITIDQDYRGCLIVEAPKLTPEKLVTNDLVTIYTPKTFEWLGRFDHVINSGGVKLLPEQIEHKLQKRIVQRFFIAGLPDAHLGEKVVLIIEGPAQKISEHFFDGLDKFEVPKAVYFIETFLETASGKIQRQATLKLLKKPLN
ncbi:MAG: AMP-binding protein [Algicola sp.]|nr:AMP-binding protein [Algicola sp.]